MRKVSTKKQFIIIAVAALVVSVSFLYGIEPTAAATTTTITLTTNNTHPATNQPFTLSGTLKAGTTPLSGKSITLYRQVLGVRTVVNTTTTDANGAYTFTRSESAPGNYNYQTIFYGDATYAPSNTAAVTFTIGTLTPTTITLTTNNTHPATNQPFTLSGTLKAGTTPLSGKSITLYRQVLGVRTVVNTTTTDANGAYTFTRSESAPGSYNYQTIFYGDATYAPSNTAAVTFTIGTLTPTTITLTTNNTHPATNQPFTLSGTLKAGTTPLSGKSITLYRQVLGVRTVVNTTTTDANGAYTFTRSESAPGSYNYQTIFYGDATYAPSNTAAVTFTIGTLTPTTITLTTNNTHPATNQPFTLSGTLKAGTTPLSGKSITLYRQVLGVRTVVNTTTTDANGAYTFTRSESAPGNYNYQTIFYGDATYAPSNTAAVTFTIGTLTPTTITLTTNNTHPATNQPFTLSGTLKA